MHTHIICEHISNKFISHLPYNSKYLLLFCHSSEICISNADTSRKHDSGLGNILTTLVLHFTFCLTHSRVLLVHSFLCGDHGTINTVKLSSTFRTNHTAKSSGLVKYFLPPLSIAFLTKSSKHGIACVLIIKK